MNYWFTGPNLPSSAGVARRWVSDLLRHNGHALLVDRAELCTSELVANAHLHTCSRVITVEVSLVAARVLVRVHDDAPDREPQRRATWADPGVLGCSGRGLGLVGILADAWSVESGPASKYVWFALDAPGAK
ncbi:ATP-binding protein [Streptomyces sp. NPDC059913]|uniref:ATP-binding protein n=1 Tax=unclassified Streptomyces TaxID=2593676 RepID=UPI00365AA1A6